jgi:DNA-directed RNA polymerase specialized sigma subunit
MDIKMFLNQAFHLNGLIEANRLELARLRDLSMSVRTPDLTKERVQSSGHNDKTGEIVAGIVDLENEIRADIRRYVKVKRDIRRVINAVADTKLKLILQERYINFKKWEEIADAMNYTVRRVLQVHSEALQEAAKKKSVGEKSL